MEVSSAHQMNVFLLCVLSGILCGIFFDIQRFLRRIRFAGGMRTTVEDVLFATVSIALVLGFGFRFNYGEIRYYQVMGSISGVLFYSAFMSRIMMRVFDILHKLIKNIVIIPAIKICTFLMRPVRKLVRLLKRALKSLKRLMKKVLQNIKKRKKHLKKRMKML